MSEKSSSHVFRRGLEILDLIANARQGLTVCDLSETVDLHRSAVYRYLAPLADARYVETRSDGRYHLGLRVLEIASLALERLDVRNTAHPLLVQLSEANDATVHLAQLDGTEVVYLDKVETHRSLPLVSRIGGRQPAYCTGVGKALLAFLPQERLEKVLDNLSFERFTPRTITDRRALLEELRVIRDRGCALDLEEHEAGICCAAAPILDIYGEPIASISLTVLARVMEQSMDTYIRHIMDAAGAVSRTFGNRVHASPEPGSAERRKTGKTASPEDGPRKEGTRLQRRRTR